MTSRQHTPLILIDKTETRRLPPVSMQAHTVSGGYDEASIRDLIFAHPEAIPIQEIDPSFGPLVPVCVELNATGAGYADALFINSLGMLTIVECKLWRNPEARREVVGQILDYARALKHWTYEDLSRGVARAREPVLFDLIAHMRENGHSDLDAPAFIDNVTRNLAKGRMLLLVLGDGIREGVEAIGAFLQEGSGLHFSFGLVEAQVYDLGDGRRILQPRVLARTVDIVRKLVKIGPDLLTDEEPAGAERNRSKVPMTEREKWLQGFWTEFLNGLKLDHPDQRRAKVEAQPSIFFPMLPGRGDWGLWITARIPSAGNSAEVFLAYDTRVQTAIEVIKLLEAQKSEITTEFAKTDIHVVCARKPDGKFQIIVAKSFPDIQKDSNRAAEMAWFSRAINAFVNVLGPRVTAHWNELTNGGGDV